MSETNQIFAFGKSGGEPKIECNPPLCYWEQPGPTSTMSYDLMLGLLVGVIIGGGTAMLGQIAGRIIFERPR